MPKQRESVAISTYATIESVLLPFHERKENGEWNVENPTRKNKKARTTLYTRYVLYIVCCINLMIKTSLFRIDKFSQSYHQIYPLEHMSVLERF